VGTAAAVASEVSVSLLLYAGPGLMRSLTTVLTVQAAAMSVGLWSAPAAPRRDLLEAVRRRWLFCLVAFLAATLYSASWSVLEPLGGEAFGQGLGLGLMAALPLFACGAVLGGVSSVAALDSGTRLRSVGGAAFTGAVIGFMSTGLALPRALAPASLYLACLVLLSAGGLLWGGALDRRVRVEVKERRPSPWGEVRVEDRRLPAAEQAARVLLEADHVRRWVAAEDAVVVPWDVCVLRGWAPEEEEPRRVLLVGGGASMLPTTAVREFPHLSVDVIERNPVVAELAGAHLVSGAALESDRVRTFTGNLADRLQELGPGAYDLVVVDTTALGPVGGVAGLARVEHEGLSRAVGAGGALLFGPMAVPDAAPDGWATATALRPLRHPVEGLEVGWPREEAVSAASPAGDLAWLSRVEGFATGGDPEPAAGR
jgi:hypothetical protein